MGKPQIPGEVYDSVIIGGGPAGLTAGLYMSRAGFKVLLIEGASSVSQITLTDLIENYPGFPDGIEGFELVERFKKQAVKFGLEIISGDVTSISRRKWGEASGWEVAAGSNIHGALAVILATGAHWRKLGIPGEDAFVGKGVSYCATCDGPFFRNKDVIVVGGGDTAVQEAVFLTNFARKVMILHRRDRLRATGILQKRAFANKKIEFLWNSIVEEISGSNLVEKVRIRDLQVAGQTRDIPAEGVFIFIGLIPNTEVVSGLVELDQHGYVMVDSHMGTSAEGIFACGDSIQKLLRQVITACGDGATAAFSAQLYIEALKGESY